MSAAAPARRAARATAPAGGPRRPRQARLVAPWRRLRRMGTALQLLLAVAVACALAGVLPQEPTAPTTVAHWRAGAAGPGQATTAVLDHLGLLDVLGSWWFWALVALLLTSLVACLADRCGALVRSVRRPPSAGGPLEALVHRQILSTALEPPQALAAAARALRRRGFRVALQPPERTPAGWPRVSADRLHAPEAASLAFHVAILLLLAAVAAGRLLGFTGQVDLAEGEAFAETAIAYDRRSAGAAWSTGDHRGFRVDVDAFRMTEHPDGTPREQVAVVRVDGGPPREVAVNHPLRHDGMSLHLARWGLAPDVEVRDRRSGALLAEGPVHLAAAGPLAWAGLLVVDPGGPGRDQVVLDLVLLPDADIGSDGRPTAVGAGAEPVLLVDVYTGPQVLRTRGERREVDRGLPALGTTATLAATAPAPVGDGRYEVTFSGPRRWVGFQVSRTPGSRAALAAAVLLLVGLTASLRWYPMRLWVEAVPEAGGATIRLAGAARADPDVFARAFARHAAAVRRATAATVVGDRCR